MNRACGMHGREDKRKVKRREKITGKPENKRVLG
jgi:hypothetical protein